MEKNSIYSGLADSLRRFIFRNLEAYPDQTSLEYLKEKIFSMLSFLISVSIGPIMLYGAWMFYQTGYVLPAIFEAMLCIVILLVLNTNLLPRYAKHLFTVISFYLAGILLILITGPSGAGMVCIVFSFVLSLSFITRRHSVTLFFTNIAVMMVLTVLLLTDRLDGLYIVMYKPTWIMNVVCLLLCIIAMFYVWDHIFSRLNAQLTALKTSEEKYRTIAGNTADVIWVVDLETMKFTYISPSVERLRGYTAEEAMSQDIFATMPSDYAKMLYGQIEDALSEVRESGDVGPTMYSQIQQFCKDGSTIWVEFSAQCRFNERGGLEAVGVSRDITERLQKEEKIKYISTHDQLTDLYNLNALRMFMVDAGDRYGENSPYSFIILDIDAFRIVNENLGHTLGDQMLIQMAGNIKETVGQKGTVYRNEGDEFVAVILSTDPDEIEQICHDLKRILSNSMPVKDRIYLLTASIGYCVGGTGKTVDTVINQAGTAHYIAKKKKNTIVAYQESMDKQRTRDVLIESDLHKALDNNEFELYFQPIVKAESGMIDHAEALIRWNHPEYGMVSPGEFIPIAEKNKLIIPITCWVVKECCSKLKEWERLGIYDLDLSINLSAVWFYHQNDETSNFILRTIRDAGVDPSRIKLEITESVLISDAEKIIGMLQIMKDHGLKLALDDFGTGYSSFGYMKDIPLDILKLDRSLIIALDDERGQMIVRSMITIAQGLGLRVVGEGVETLPQLEYLKENGCDLIQGYYFSKPLAIKAFEDYLNKKPSA